MSIDFKGKFKGMLKKASKGEQIPLFMCVIRNLAAQYDMTATEAAAQILTGEWTPTDVELKTAGEVCIGAGKFRTLTQLRTTFADVRKGYEGKSMFWAKVGEKVKSKGKKVVTGRIYPETEKEKAEKKAKAKATKAGKKAKA